MIDINHFKRNNFVFFINKEGQIQIDRVVSILDDGSVHTKNYGFRHDAEDLNPIPLTPEILEQCGWILVDQGSGPYYWNEKYCWLHIYQNKEEGYLYSNYNGFVTYLNHLHKLQNIIFPLTGEELVWKNEKAQANL